MRVPGLALSLIILAGAAAAETLAEFSIYSNEGWDNDCKDLIDRVRVTDKECHHTEDDVQIFKYQVHQAPDYDCRVVFYGNRACSDRIGLTGPVMRIFPRDKLEKCSSTIGVMSTPVAWRLECKADGY